MRPKKKKVRRFAGKAKSRSGILPADLAWKNRGLAFRLASYRWNTNSWRFEKMGYTMEDLRQQAMLDMTRAAYDWKPGKGRFTTLAGTYVKHGLDNILKTESAEKRAGKPRSLSPFKDSTIRLIPRFAERQEINLAAELAKVKRIVDGIKGHEQYKKIFFERFGLDGEEPRRQVEIARKHKVSKATVNNAIKFIQKKLAWKMKNQ